MNIASCGRLFWIVGMLSLITACSSEPGRVPEWGVSQELARERSLRIQDLAYQLQLEIPELQSDPIHGTITATFQLAQPDQPLVLDFRQESSRLLAVEANQREAAYTLVNGHILIESARLREGANSLTVEFLAGDESLNRRPDHLYTLFVPDRASVAIPCFDQPDLKARYSLLLEIPEKWTAVANGSLASEEVEAGRKQLEFAPTQPLSTYQLAFAVGLFQVEEREVGGRKMHLYHRETNPETVARNLDAIFELHGRSLDWLEDYTGIPYPYEKFDFVLLPAFQYGGMEHPGAIFYADRGLWLEETPTLQQILNRANTIAHETSHMWFGNLVTMRWFDDVWTKEVYANFMAGKIANPLFPEVNHELRFFLNHYPAAYGVDRTPGANPIRQPLDNLVNAGSLYGAIIYEKAPIVMRQLEDLLGEDKLQQGLRSYLQRFSYGNASWPELVEILDPLTDIDLAAWSRVWVGEPGRPRIEVVAQRSQTQLSALSLRQMDSLEKGRIWSQPIQPGYRRDGEALEQRFFFSQSERELPEWVGKPVPDYILPNAGSRAYGLFLLDSSSCDYLLAHLAQVSPDLERAVALDDLWENLLEGRVRPDALLETVVAALSEESNELLLGQQLGILRELFWEYLPVSERDERAPALENLLWSLLQSASSESRKANLFATYRQIARSPAALARLRDIWSSRGSPAGLKLSENDFIDLATELSVALDSTAIFETQIEQTSNPDRKARLEFIRPAISPDPQVRQAFFETLKEASNREREPWVLAALAVLHHPLRKESSIQFLKPSLELLEEIQRTGDIFFPKRWLDVTFRSHDSAQALEIVEDFLTRRPDYPASLRDKILQSTDLLRRKVRILGH